MNRYLDIAFRSKLRLLIVLVLLPVALSSLNFYQSRSYTAVQVVWVGDLGSFGPGVYNAISYNGYMGPAQNATIRLSNLIGNQKFGDAIGDKLLADGVIHSTGERAAVIASLSKLVIFPGGASSIGGGAVGGGDFGPDHTIAIAYTCTVPDICNAVLTDVLTIFRYQYGELKAREAEIARGIYQAQAKAAEADVAAATAALKAYDAATPKKGPGESSDAFADPARAVLQANLDDASKQITAIKTNLANVETSLQVANGVSNNMYVIDGPTIQRGLFGIAGLRADNLKGDAIIWFCCFAAAVAYLLLFAFFDRTVRDPGQIKSRIQTPVVAIPAH